MLHKTFCFLLVIGIGISVFGQSSGKISGVVRDKENRAPLPGVNVVIKDSFMGASTDTDGFYTILNVPPGNYVISFSYVGYQTVEVENVRVVADITKRLETNLQATSIELEDAIVVVADRPFFEVAATNTVRVMDSDEIERIPVKGINAIVSINAGVVSADGSGGDTDNATVNVRGGRGNETLFIVDGIPFNDVVFGNVTGTIPDAAIEQVSSQLGGFSAKYGSAQSGIINITTKSGASRFFGSTDAVSSNFTDDFNYNSFTGSLGGPLGGPNFSFFASGEFVTTDDQRPRASGLVIPSAGINLDARPNMDSDVTRFTGKINGNFSKFKLTLSANGSFRDGRSYIHDYAKNNSEHHPIREEDVIGASFRFSHVINPTTFWDVTFRGKHTDFKTGDGLWYQDIEAYGDSVKNAAIGVTLPLGDGTRVGGDDVGVFFDNGRVSNRFRKYEIFTGGLDLNFTKQLQSHLIEIGATMERHQLRFYDISPVVLAEDRATTPDDIRFASAVNRFYGYDIFGDKISDTSFRTVEGDRFEEAAPKRPVIAGAYIQDRVEFQDFILNLGFRWDYFDPDFNRLRDPENVFIFGDNPNRLDEEDFEEAPTENYISPRIGFAFPMTEHTVFHAQYGIFRQPARFFDIYDSWVNLDIIEQRDGQGQNNGHVEMEKTTNYEFGFKQQFGNTASLDITAYYRNVQGLVNLTTIRTKLGETNRTYISKVNQDFGTIKGMAFSFNLRRLGPLSTKIDYTLALNEGTGSDPSSNRTATFRNPDHEIPLAIAPLDFDQRHTLTGSVDIRANKGEGPDILGTKLLSDAGANFLLTYNSGRPYTPVEKVDPLGDQTLFGSTTTQFVNSATMQGVFRIDMRVDKQIHWGRITLNPYLWIQNLLDRDNFNDVWRSTGKPDDTGFLDTAEGQQLLRVQSANNADYESDFNAFERDPENYGLPRLIRLGLKLKF